MPRGDRLGDTLPWRLIAHPAMDDKNWMPLTLILNDRRWSNEHPASMSHIGRVTCRPNPLA